MICGTTLQDAGGGAGQAPYYVLQAPATISYIPQTLPLYFQVAPGCAHGSQVTWTPRSAAHLVKAAYASDGLAAALVLQPTGHPKVFRLVVETSRRALRTITVQPESGNPVPGNA